MYNDIIHHYSIRQSIKLLLSLKILCAPSIYPSTLQSQMTGNHQSFHCLHSFPFSRMSPSWNHIVGSLFKFDFFFTQYHAFKVPPYHFMTRLLISSQSWVIFVVWLYHSLFIHCPTEGQHGCFQVNTAGILSMYRSSVDIIFQPLWIYTNDHDCQILW